MTNSYALRFGRGRYDRFVLNVKQVSLRQWHVQQVGRAGSAAIVFTPDSLPDTIVRLYRDRYYPDGEIMLLADATAPAAVTAQREGYHHRGAA
jgi:hypothetical protein